MTGDGNPCTPHRHPFSRPQGRRRSTRVLTAGIRCVFLLLLLLATTRIVGWPQKQALDAQEASLDREIQDLYHYRDTLKLAIHSRSHAVLLLKQNALLGLDLQPAFARENMSSQLAPEPESILDGDTLLVPIETANAD